MAHVHGCSLTQFSQLLNEFFLWALNAGPLPYSNLAQGQHHGVIHAQCPALTVAHAPQDAARQHTPRSRQSEPMSSPLISIKVLHKSLRGLVLPALQTRKNKHINFQGKYGSGGGSHAVAPKRNSLKNNAVDY